MGSSQAPPPRWPARPVLFPHPADRAAPDRPPPLPTGRDSRLPRARPGDGLTGPAEVGPASRLRRLSVGAFRHPLPDPFAPDDSRGNPGPRHSSTDGSAWCAEPTLQDVRRRSAAQTPSPRSGRAARPRGTSSRRGVRAASFAASRSPPWSTRSSHDRGPCLVDGGVQRGVARPVPHAHVGAELEREPRRLQVGPARRRATPRPPRAERGGCAGRSRRCSSGRPAAIISGVVPSHSGRNGSAPASARVRMAPTSAYLAASRKGVAPASDPGSTHQWVARGTRLPRVRRMSGSAPCARSVRTSRVVGAQHRGVERRVAGPGRVRFGAPAQQERGQLAVAAEAGHNQRRRTVRGGLVHVRPRVEQQPGALHASLPGREQQWREAPQR